MTKTVAYRYRVFGKGIVFRLECHVRYRAQIIAALQAQGYQLTLLAERVHTDGELPLESPVQEWIGAN